jgi:hypothetical protein
MNARLDPAVADPAPQRVAIHSLGDDREQVVRRDRVFPRRHRAAHDSGERGAIPGVQLGATRVLLVEPLEPMHAERGARIVEAKVEPQLDDVVAAGVAAVLVPAQRGHPVRPQAPDPLGQVLVGEEAERGGVAERADVPRADPGADGVRGVLQEQQPVAAGELAERLDLAYRDRREVNRCKP